MGTVVFTVLTFLHQQKRTRNQRKFKIRYFNKLWKLERKPNYKEFLRRIKKNIFNGQIQLRQSNAQSSYLKLKLEVIQTMNLNVVIKLTIH